MPANLDSVVLERVRNGCRLLWLRRLVRWFMAPPDEAPPFAAAILDRFPVGAIFLIEGILKFRLPLEFGVGRFTRIGIPVPQFFAPFDGTFEIGCGILLLLG